MSGVGFRVCTSDLLSKLATDSGCQGSTTFQILYLKRCVCADPWQGVAGTHGRLQSPVSYHCSLRSVRPCHPAQSANR